MSDGDSHRISIRRIHSTLGDVFRAAAIAMISSTPRAFRSENEDRAWSLSRRWVRADTYWCLGVGIAAFILAFSYIRQYRSTGEVPFYYQEQFGPAVMSACGRGFVAPRNSPDALNAFLSQRVNRFDCDQIPTDIRVIQPNPFQRFSRYLLQSAALTWRFTGVSWSAIDDLTAAFFALTISGAFVFMRFIAGRSLTLLITALWATSSWHLRHLPHLRDYSKLPFFIVMLLATAVVFVECRPRRLVVLGLAFGAIEGIGYGMRADVAFNLVPFLLVLFSVAPNGVVRTLRAKSACAVTCVVAFGIVAAPIVSSYQESGALWHVALLGLTSPYDVNLALLRPLPPYSLGYLYHDGYIEAVTNSNWTIFHEHAKYVELVKNGYGEICRSYYLSLARTFPGDLVTRMIATAFHVFEMPFGTVYSPDLLGISSRMTVAVLNARNALMSVGDGFGLIGVLFVLVLAGVERLSYALLGFVVILACGVYPSIQYQYRHTFQLEFLVLAVLASGVTLSRRVYWRVTNRPARQELVHVTQASGIVLSMLVAAILVVFLARGFQVPRVRQLLMAYASAPVESVPTTSVALTSDSMLLAADVFKTPAASTEVQTVMLATDVELDRCDAAQPISVTFKYDKATAMDLDLAFTATLAAGRRGMPRVVNPVYQLYRAGSMMSKFVGVEVPSAVVPCVHLYRIRDPQLLHGPLLPATLNTNWKSEPLYQRMPLAKAVPPIAWRAIIRWWPGMAHVG